MTKATPWICALLTSSTTFGSLGAALLIVSQHAAPSNCPAPSIIVQRQPSITPSLMPAARHVEERYFL